MKKGKRVLSAIAAAAMVLAFGVSATVSADEKAAPAGNSIVNSNTVGLGVGAVVLTLATGGASSLAWAGHAAYTALGGGVGWFAGPKVEAAVAVKK